MVARFQHHLFAIDSEENAEDAWLAHREKAAELRARGYAPRSLSSFADYVEIEKIKLGVLIEM